MHQKEASQGVSWFDCTSPRLAQMVVLVHLDATYIGHVIISWFS